MFANLMSKYDGPDQSNIGRGATAWNTANNPDLNNVNFTPPRGKDAAGNPKPGWPSYDAAMAAYKGK